MVKISFKKNPASTVALFIGLILFFIGISAADHTANDDSVAFPDSRKSTLGPLAFFGIIIGFIMICFSIYIIGEFWK